MPLGQGRRAFAAWLALCYHPPEMGHARTCHPNYPKDATVDAAIVLYAKAGCHLCDDARSHLEDLAADYHITFDEVDIRRDPIIFERYRYRIPVITVNGDERLEGRIAAGDVRALLDDLRLSGG